jgi:hypothetical protein
MSQLQLLVLLTRLLLGCGLMLPSSLLAADEFIPSSLSKEKQERLNQFLDQVKREAKGGFILANAQIRVWAPHMTLDIPAAGEEVKEYLAAVNPHRPTDAAKGPDQADVYWYRPNPKKGSPGVTVKRVVDLNTGKQVGVPEVLIGYPAPLTREEREQALALAKEKVEAVRNLLKEGEKDVILEVLFETVTSEKNPDGQPGDRVVTLRIRKKGEKKLVAANVNLTKQTVRVP